MGVFSRLRGVFGSKKASRQEELDTSQIAKAKDLMQSYHHEKGNLVDVLQQAKKKTEELQKGENFFSEARKKEISVLDKLLSLLNEIAEKDKLDIDTDNIHSLKDFCNTFDERIKEFTETSALDFRDTKQILATEINHVRDSMSKIEKYIAELKTLLERYGKDSESEEKLEGFEKSIENIEKLDFPELNEKFSLISEDTSYENLLKKKDLFAEKQNLLEKDLKGKFDQILGVLRQYNSRNSNIGIVSLYINSPMTALLSDQNFEILKHLKKIRNLVRKNRLEFDSQKKMLEAIDSITKPYLISIVTEFKKSGEEIERLSDTLKEHHIEQYTSDLQQKVKSLSSKTLDLKQNIHKIEIELHEKELHKIDDSIKETKKNIDEE